MHRFRYENSFCKDIIKIITNLIKNEKSSIIFLFYDKWVYNDDK